MAQLWGERFKKGLQTSAKKFSYSLEVDHRLLTADVKASIVHVLMLEKTGLISETESKKLARGLQNVLENLRRKCVSEFVDDVEDIHTLIQTALEKKIGLLAKKLHTGRSRNDLVSTSSRLYLKEAVSGLFSQIVQFQLALVSAAEKYESVLIPGYTHLQRAQIVLFAHHLLAYVEMLERDKSRLSDLKNRFNECPLGAGAIAGSGLPLDRGFVARLLGFRKPTANSIDAVSDRDFVVETISAVAILFMHLSRLSEDVILWTSSEFGFVTLSDEFSTGSSLMPHKKNPDMLELVRGKTGEVYGHLMSVLTTMKGLPLAYNRDMQQDKKPLFESLQLATSALEVLIGVFGTLQVNKEPCAKAVNDSFLYATDLLEYLVQRKVAFRDAHDVVGKLVRHAVESHKNLSGLSLETYQKFSNKFKKDVFDLFDPKTSVMNKLTSGSTNPKLVKTELNNWKKELKLQLSHLKKAEKHDA